MNQGQHPRWREDFPDLYQSLNSTQQQAMDQVLSSHYLEGLVPDRALVADLVATVHGQLSRDDYDTRSRARTQSQNDSTD
ncbi:antitoxin VbhA family protein [Nocardia carnea]|uniref:antitoxin VbhA family protein n=1 Tax=Nocardia carnea TaxID=37328 RepID=UPI0024566ADB|nr:antitoxin VbhA family protein [Nocardia carnea]